MYCGFLQNLFFWLGDRNLQCIALQYKDFSNTADMGPKLRIGHQHDTTSCSMSSNHQINHHHQKPRAQCQCPFSSSLDEFPSYWDWLWYPGLSPVLVSIALPFAFHTWCFPVAVFCHWIPIRFLLYGRCIANHSADPFTFSRFR